ARQRRAPSSPARPPRPPTRRCAGRSRNPSPGATTPTGACCSRPSRPRRRSSGRPSTRCSPRAERRPPSTGCIVIELSGLGKRYGDVAAVDDLSLRVERGELLMLVGGSGRGKTTTLKMTNRLVEPSAGTVRIDGADHRSLAGHELRRRIGYCFQQVGLFPHLSVAENVAITPRLLAWPEREVAARVEEL